MGKLNLRLRLARFKMEILRLVANPEVSAGLYINQAPPVTAQQKKKQ